MKHLRRIIFLIASLFTVVHTMKAQGVQAVQNQPDCVWFFSQAITNATAGSLAYPGGNGFDNRTIGCQYYLIQYTVTVSSGAFGSVTLQAASGAVTPGSFSTWGGTVTTGANPSTGNTATITLTTGCVSGSECDIVNSWLRVVVAKGTLVGNISGAVYGWKGNNNGGGGGGGSGCTAPCVVIGKNAAGTAPTGNPVLVGGSDGTDVRTLLTDATGALIISGSVSSSCSAANVTVAPITITSTTTTLVAASSGKTITLCSISLAFASGVNFTLEQGTGSGCSGGTANVTGAYQSISAVALDNPLNLTASNGLCAVTGTTVTGGGLLLYVQQ